MKSSELAQVTFASQKYDKDYVDRMYGLALSLRGKRIYNAETGQSAAILDVVKQDGCVFIRRIYK